MERERRLQQERDEREARLMSECTFAPQLSELSRAALPHYRFDDGGALMQQIATEREFRERRLEDQRRAREAEQMTCGSGVDEGRRKAYGAISPGVYQSVSVPGLKIAQ